MDGTPTRLLLSLAALASGCTTPAQVERLEAELRDQHDRLTAQAEALDSARTERDALRLQRDRLLAGKAPVVPRSRSEPAAHRYWPAGGRGSKRPRRIAGRRWCRNGRAAAGGPESEVSATEAGRGILARACCSATAVDSRPERISMNPVGRNPRGPLDRRAEVPGCRAA